MAWESDGEWFKSLGCCIHMGGLEEAPGDWLQISSAPATEATRGVSQQMEDFSLSSLCLSASLLLLVNLIFKEQVKIKP